MTASTRSGGVLLLGASETLYQPSDAFWPHKHGPTTYSERRNLGSA